jgi:hypothetical protein
VITLAAMKHWLLCTMSDNKVRELATVFACRGSSGQKPKYGWIVVVIPAFHSCVVVDLWQPLSE